MKDVIHVKVSSIEEVKNFDDMIDNYKANK